MSVQTLYTAATGMEALQTKLDVIANNLANVNTTGFKKDRANFEDLFYRHEVYPGTEETNATGVGIQVGLGTRVSSVQMDFGQGAIQQTGRDLDLAIEGKGFFEVLDEQGNSLYTRAGNFSVNSEGELVLGSANVGRILNPPINVPEDTIDLRINPDGQVFAIQQGQNTATPLTPLTLTFFPNEEGLEKIGDNLYRETDASGAASNGNIPGQNGVGYLFQGALEASNVEPVRELVDLIQTQRNFELNSQTVQAGDEVMQLVSNLRR